MLETVREYGEARLDAVGDRDAATAGLVGWAQREAVRLADRFIGPDQLDAFARCAAEQDNLVAGLRGALGYDDEPAAVDVATALFHLWAVRGLHVEVSGWAGGLLHVDDPARRTGSAIVAGRSSGRPLPHADRLAWTCLLVSVNAGISGPRRLAAIAHRALRRLLAERPGEVSSRLTALAAALPAFALFDASEALPGTAVLIAHPDPYVQGFGLFARAAIRDSGGLPEASAADAEQAYHRFEAAGDHWGMATAAQAIGHAVAASDGGRATEWLARSVHHMDLIGATQDSRSIRVLLDVQLALAGDPAAERRLGETATPGQGAELDTAQASLGLAQLAWRRGRYAEALGHADAVTRALAGWTGPPPQPRVVLLVAVAVFHLRVAQVGAGGRTAEARALGLLVRAGGEALSSRDLPVIGTWALGGAELAAHRAEVDTARELFALGTRLGSNSATFFPPGISERLTAALVDEEQREPTLAGWRARPPGAAVARIRELMDDLLGRVRPSGGTHAAPVA